VSSVDPNKLNHILEMSDTISTDLLRSSGLLRLGRSTLQEPNQSMKEFESILTEYAKDGYFMYSNFIPRSRWGDRAVAESYLEKYWISSAEYEETWRTVQNRVFRIAATGSSEVVFQPEFEIFVMKGGCLFDEAEFDRVRSCALNLDEKFIIVIENSFAGELQEPAFRMKFPVDIEWEEMISGNFASAIMLEMPHKDYFVFGESASWGKYTANDHEIPVDIFGFKGVAERIFKSALSAADELTLEEAKLPEAYRQEMGTSLTVD
jgi:hypothetical protein